MSYNPQQIRPKALFHNYMEKRSVTAYPDAPDIESSTQDYASRFYGPVGAWFLECQADATRNLLGGANLAVLDVGGGHGQNVGTVLDLGHTLTVFGSTDATTEMIQQDIDSGRIRYETGSFLELPYNDNSFDVVISYRTLSHMDHWSPFIAELCRVSKATVIVDYPASRSFNILYNPMYFIKKNIERNTREFYCYSSNTINTVFGNNNLALISKHKQFFLPMAIHRFLGMRRLSQLLEKLSRVLLLTRVFGSPVIAGYRKDNQG